MAVAGGRPAHELPSHDGLATPTACLQCDALNELYIASILVFTLTWVLLAGKLGAALVNVRSGTRELRRLREAGLPTELKPDAPLPVLLRDPLTRRACGMAEARAAPVSRCARRIVSYLTNHIVSYRIIRACFCRGTSRPPAAAPFQTSVAAAAARAQ